MAIPTPPRYESRARHGTVQSGPTPTTTPLNWLSLAPSSALKSSHPGQPTGSMPPMSLVPTAKSPWKHIRSRIGCTNGTVQPILRVKATSRSASARTTVWITLRSRFASTNSTLSHPPCWWTYRRRAACTPTVRSSSKAPHPTPTREPTEATSSRFGSRSSDRAPRSPSSNKDQPVGPTNGTSLSSQRVNTPSKSGLPTAISASVKQRPQRVAFPKHERSPSTTTTFHPTSSSRGLERKISPAAASTAARCEPRTTPKSWVLLATLEAL